MMPQLAKEINLEALINDIEASFDPEQSSNDRRILYDVTGLKLDDGTNPDMIDEDISDKHEIGSMTTRKI